MQSALYNPTQSTDFPVYGGNSSSILLPFAVSLNNTTAVLNTYSTLLSSFSARQSLNMFGLSLSYTIAYGSKIYLETYYDSNLNPFGARIRADERWTQAVNIITKADGPTDINVYPSEFDIIQKADLETRQSDLADDIESATQLVSNAITQINSDISNQVITPDVGATSIANLNAELLIYRNDISSNLAKINSMFSGRYATKKLIRSYKLIAYTTHNLDSNLNGTLVYPIDGARQYQLVQCVHNDLMLVSDCFNGVPIKVAIPWTRPIYLFEGEE